MWRVGRIELASRTLDFTSSGQAPRSTKALLADGVEIVNALDLVDFDDPSQLLVCKQCGIHGCASGGWASSRRLGDALVIAPAFLQMEEDESDEGEHRPPTFMRAKGIPLIGGRALEELRSAVPWFDRIAELPRLDGHEAARIMQWEAPQGILGRCPGAPLLRREAVASVGHGDDEETLSRFGELLDEAFASFAAVAPTACEPVPFYLEEQLGFPEWAPFGLHGAEHVLTLGPGLGFRIGAASM
jgi:hypothetical protein